MTTTELMPYVKRVYDLLESGEVGCFTWHEQFERAADELAAKLKEAGYTGQMTPVKRPENN